jgi:guanine deaminase
VALGTDIGAGRTFSMRRVAASAYDAALVLDAPVPSADLLWLATRGGALALGQGARLGCLDVGYAADLVAIDAPAGLGVDALIDALLFRHDAGPARSTVIGGRLCHGVA